jgi:hypothetical protein
VDQEGRVFWIKRLDLACGGFVLGTHVEPLDVLEGFGLFVLRRGERGFSWEWFDRGAGEVFDKLQGVGHLRVTTTQVGPKVELQSIEFLDDITLRYSDHIGSGDDTHVVTVRKGSRLWVQ